MDLLLYHAAQVVTPVRGDTAHPRGALCGEAMRNVAVIEDGAVGVTGGRIVYVGPTDGVDITSAENTYSARGCVILPGFIDAHTHLVFAGAREGDFARRIAGASYAEIAAAGGGINTTVRATRAATREELVEGALARLDLCLGFGATTVEIKSGYGLDAEHELVLLEAVAELRAQHVVDVVPTFLGAHTVPFDWRDRRDDYVRTVIDEMLPAVAARGLAEYCDVFVERGAFTPDDARAIFTAARGLGLGVRVHADQITAGGGAGLAADFHAASADHLDHASEADLARMRDAGTVAVLLPGVSLFLGESFPDARRLIDAGLPVAVATDANPGSCMSENIQLMMSLAAMRMRMTMEEVVTSVTLNAAAALDRADRIGSLEEGKQADMLVFDVPDYRRIIYHLGVNHLAAVVKTGEFVLEKASSAF
jgi:imidazolonepropionase